MNVDWLSILFFGIHQLRVYVNPALYNKSVVLMNESNDENSMIYEGDFTYIIV